MPIRGGGGAQNLQDVTTQGNVTADDIFIISNAVGVGKRFTDMFDNVEHFDGPGLPAGWLWWNEPTGTNGLEIINLSMFVLQADDSLKKTMLYRPITTYLNGVALMKMTVEYAAQGGFRLDDGTDNNYVEFFMSYLAAGYVYMAWRTRLGGGAVTTTTLIASAIFGTYGLMIYAGGSPGNWLVNCYLFTVFGNSQYLGSTGALNFVPTRLGIFNTKAYAGGGESTITDWWKQITFA